MPNDRDAEIESLKVRLAALEQPPGTVIQKPGMSTGKKIAIWIALAFVLLIAVLAVTPSSMTVAEYYASECVGQKGYGEWRGSMGATLEQFCKVSGQLKAAEDDRRKHPEKY